MSVIKKPKDIPEPKNKRRNKRPMISVEIKKIFLISSTVFFSGGLLKKPCILSMSFLIFLFFTKFLIKLANLSKFRVLGIFIASKVY